MTKEENYINCLNVVLIHHSTKSKDLLLNFSENLIFSSICFINSNTYY